MVTEIGTELNVLTLVQLPWQERFRVGKDFFTGYKS